MREFLGAQSSVQRQKTQLVNFKGMQLKKELCHFTRLFLHSAQNTWCIFCGMVWFHRNGTFSFVETSFSRCVCLVFDCCQFDCSLHINCLILSQMKLITVTVTCSLMKSLIFLPSLKAPMGLNTSLSFYYMYIMIFLNSTLKFSVWVLNRRRWLCQ